MPAAKLVGKLALGIGLIFVRSLAAQLDDRALDRIPLQPVERAAQLVEFNRLFVDWLLVEQFDFARRVRIDCAFVRSFELQLTC